jgi:Activator of Hsp90 ATPase homolog 1-like protein
VTDEPAAGERVVVRRVIGAPRERVFRNWTEPEQLRRWWGPGAFTCPDAQVDLRAGGTYRLVMQAPGGGPLMSVAGTYRTEPKVRKIASPVNAGKVWCKGPARNVPVSPASSPPTANEVNTPVVAATNCRRPFAGAVSRCGWYLGRG